MARPDAEEMSRVFDHLESLAQSSGRSFWVAWIGGAFFVVDAAQPADALLAKDETLIPVAIDVGVWRRARWFVAPGDFVLDLG